MDWRARRTDIGRAGNEEEEDEKERRGGNEETVDEERADEAVTAAGTGWGDDVGLVLVHAIAAPARVPIEELLFTGDAFIAGVGGSGGAGTGAGTEAGATAATLLGATDAVTCFCSGGFACC